VKSFVLSVSLSLHGHGERVSARNLRPEITEPGCWTEWEAMVYTQKWLHHDISADYKEWCRGALGLGSDGNGPAVHMG
jgi:hypothetical protein